MAPPFTVVVRCYGHALGTNPRGDPVRGLYCSVAVLHLRVRDVLDMSDCRRALLWQRRRSEDGGQRAVAFGRVTWPGPVWKQ